MSKEMNEQFPLPEGYELIPGYRSLVAYTRYGQTQIMTREQAKIRKGCHAFDVDPLGQARDVKYNRPLRGFVWGDGYEQIDHILNREFNPETVSDAARYMINRIAEKAGLKVTIETKGGPDV